MGPGTVEWIDISGGTTGLIATGGPILTSGTITLSGILNVSNGGIGTSTLETNSILLGNGSEVVKTLTTASVGYVLVSNGTDNPPYWSDNVGITVTTATNVVGGIADVSSIILPYAAETAVSWITTVTQQTVVDNFSSSAYRSAKYLVQISTDNAHQISELLLIHDDTDVYMTQYGDIYTDGQLGVFDSTIAGTSVALLFTPVNTATTLYLNRTVINRV
jgi:hypothetical protein